MGWQSKVHWASVIMPYFPAIGLQLLRYYELMAFSFTWWPSTILDSEKFEILTAVPVRRAIMRHQAKFRANRSNRCKDMAVDPFCFSLFLKRSPQFSPNRYT